VAASLGLGRCLGAASRAESLTSRCPRTTLPRRRTRVCPVLKGVLRQTLGASSGRRGGKAARSCRFITQDNVVEPPLTGVPPGRGVWDRCEGRHPFAGWRVAPRDTVGEAETVPAFRVDVQLEGSTDLLRCLRPPKGVRQARWVLHGGPDEQWARLRAEVGDRGEFGAQLHP